MRTTGTIASLSLFLALSCSSNPRQDDATAQPTDDGQTTGDGSSTRAPSGELDPTQSFDLNTQRRRVIVEQSIEQARYLRDNLFLEEAEREILSALEHEPDNLEAKQLQAEIGALLGRDAGSARTLTQQLSDEYELRTQQLEAEAADHLHKGEVALERGDYDTAIAQLTLAQNHIRWAPYSIDWKGTDARVDALLEQAKADRTAATDEARREAQRKAREALQAAEAAEQARREKQVANILGRAIDSFERGQYDASIEFADQALRKDPRNAQAVEVRDAAFRAGRDKVRADYIEDKREEFAKWREHLQELTIPWTDVITLPDPDDWRRVSAVRSSRRGLDLSRTQSESELALAAQLESTTVALPGVQGEESLRTVMKFIRDFTNLPIVVDQAAENAVFDEGIEFTFNFENDITVAQALNLITDFAGDEVTWTIRHDAVLVTTREKARGNPVVYNHDVQDIIRSLTNFTGPRIERIRLLDELEDDDGGGPFGGILESPRLIEIEDLVTLIQDNVVPTSWDEEGVSIEPGEGFILITHSADVQQNVRDFLEDLRRFNSSLVTIESKFMTVGDNWLQEIGVDFRGLNNADVTDVTNGLEDMASRGLDNGGTGNDGQGAAGPPSAGFFYDDGQDGDFRGTSQNFFEDSLGEALTNIGGMTFQLTFLNDLELSAILRAVEKSSQFELINSQILSVHNTQRAYVTVINQQAYIQDFDVEVAQFQAIADPQVNVLHEGVVLDVRPTIHHDRKYLTLEIQPTVANVIALREFSSTLGGNTSPVQFQLPELEVQSVNTSALIPDGGSILLGGLSDIRNIERRAEVPWLARVPIVGFLFKNEGYNDERESLMILIRARITDVRESVSQKLERQY